MEDLIILLVIVGLVCFYFYNTKETFSNNCVIHKSELDKLNSEYNELCDQTSLTINERMNCRTNYDNRKIFLETNIKNCDCEYDSNLEVDPIDEDNENYQIV